MKTKLQTDTGVVSSITDAPGSAAKIQPPPTPEPAAEIPRCRPAEFHKYQLLKTLVPVPALTPPTLIVISLIVVSLTVMIVVSQIAGPIEVREVSEDAVVLVVRPCGEE
ncbi:MAG TPA: hypothetical protein VI215_10590, partial [Bacteroidota bacterium]